jgi:16S rRNA (guanine1207-N2)-methyltransferase
MVDINERAVELSVENAAINQITNAKIYQSDLFSKVDPVHSFASIVTNPPIRAGKKVVHAIFEKSAGYLLDSGELWVVIQKKQGASSALKKLESLFQNVSVIEKKKGYFIIQAKKFDS